MALLGAQLVITLIVVSIIQKLSPHFSFARWMLCSTGLIRHLYPTDQELKTLAGIPREKGKKGKNGKNSDHEKTNETFHVPRNLDVTLETAKVSPLDVVHLKFYSDFQWLFDFSVYSIFVYLSTEIYNHWYPIEDEINLSILWCFLVVGFSFKVLVTLWVQYFKGEESIGERSTCIVTGFAYLLCAMIILTIDENILEIGIDQAYVNFNKSASLFLKTQGLSSTGPASIIVIKFTFAILCGFVGSLFTFPGLRMAKMHWDLLKYYNNNKVILLLANISYAAPVFLASLWIKPISRDYLTARIFSGMEKPIMTEDTFESLRLIAIVVTVLLKLALMPFYLQSYLNLAAQRLEMQKKEAGRISNTEFQKKIAAVFYYLCVVALQYVAPIIMCLYFTFIYKTMGGYSWTSFYMGTRETECPAEVFPTSSLPLYDADEEKTIVQTAQEFHLVLSSLKDIFTTEVLRGIFGLATWWNCFAITATTAMGMVYQSYFANS